MIETIVLTLLAVFIIAFAAAAWKLRNRFESMGKLFMFLKDWKFRWIVPLILAVIAARLYVVMSAPTGVAVMKYPLF